MRGEAGHGSGRWYDQSSDSYSYDWDTNGDDSPDPNYECVHCSTGVHIESEHKQRVPHFCEDCDKVRDHVRR